MLPASRCGACCVAGGRHNPAPPTGRRRRAFPEPGPPSRAAHASARSMPCDAAGALAIRSGEQHGLNVIVVIDQQPLDRSGRPMQAGSEIFRQRLPMREDLPLEGDGPALGDGALDIAVIPGEQRDQRRSRLSHERRQVVGQRRAARKLLALVNDRNSHAAHHGCGLSRDVTTKSVRSVPQLEQRNLRWVSGTSPRPASISFCRSASALRRRRAHKQRRRVAPPPLSKADRRIVL